MAAATATLPARRSIAVYRWAWATLGFFVIVVLEGAVVRATSSGGGCGAHWPLCNGEILPHHPRLATIIEFLHRQLTGISSAMFAALIAGTFLTTQRGHPARRSAVYSGILLIVEALLGAVLVLGHFVENNTSAMRVVLQGVHFTNTMLLLAAVTVTAMRLRPAPQRRIAGSVRPLFIAALVLALLVGATGSVAALADTLFPSPTLATALHADFAAHAPVLIRMRFVHPLASLALAAVCVSLFLRLSRLGYRGVAMLLASGILAQIILGTTDVLFLAPIWLQVLHLLGADIFWISLVAMSSVTATRTMSEPV